MVDFTKEQMLDELRTIFLFEADHILLGAGEDMAAQFIGFPVGEEYEYCFQAPSKVDLSRFKGIPGSFDSGYDYAFRPSILNSLGEHEVQDLFVFMKSVPRAGGVASGGETHRFMTPDGYCQTVADAAYARWKLEWDSAGAGSHEFTPRELALLANMTEGAVRNAVADKSQNGLKAIPGTKNPIKIEHDEAVRWLNLRRGFIPSPNRPSEDRFLANHIRDIETSDRFGSFIAARLRDASGSQEDVKELGWSPDEVAHWCNGSFRFDADLAGQLARVLDVDTPLFVGKALEVSLRRNAPTFDRQK
ncbi:MAG: helix-turn-helix transcriptional regulator [Verrucomicrobiota bacterium]|jgi:hypothetical protein|nr:helix-turn-helix transcriptional regulator [Verrucomicrobiota bacterium]